MLVATRKSDGVTTKAESADSPVPASPISCIDLDRFCMGCAYNLRTLGVYRDAHTGIPVVRCPECGRIQSANDASTALRPWLDRATSVFLAMWILAIMLVIVHLGLAEGALSYSTLDELTIPGGYETQRTLNTTTFTWKNNFGPLEIRTNYEYYGFFIGSVLAVSLTTAFLCGVFTVVVCPHWHRAAAAGLLLAMPVAAGIIVAVIWKHEAPHLYNWGIPYMIAHAGAQLLGGMLGITFGRPFARLVVRIFLPPGVRPKLAYLWLADGKPLPPRER